MQLLEVDKMNQLENLKIPENFNFDQVSGISQEALEKLNKIRPKTLGQASRISGITPADITAIQIQFAKIGRIR